MLGQSLEALLGKHGIYVEGDNVSHCAIERVVFPSPMATLSYCHPIGTLLYMGCP